jgi:hypothetical protein
VARVRYHGEEAAVGDFRHKLREVLVCSVCTEIRTITASELNYQLTCSKWPKQITARRIKSAQLSAGC